MEHIVQFGISIDDEAIRSSIKASAERSITESLERQIQREIFDSNRWGNNGFTRWAEQIFLDFLERNKDRIVDEAAKMLSERMIRTKAVKDAVGKVVAE